MKLYKNYNNNQFQIGKRNIPEKLKNEIDNNIKKTLKSFNFFFNIISL